MKVKIKKLNAQAIIPKYSKEGDAAVDFTAQSKSYDEHGNIVYATNLAIEIPKGYFMMLVPRSSNAKTDLLLTNHCGIIDSGFRGNITFKYATYLKEGENWNKHEEYNVGDRIGQGIILPYPNIEFEEVEELSDSERGEGGYGSTGK